MREPKDGQTEAMRVITTQPRKYPASFSAIMMGDKIVNNRFLIPVVLVAAAFAFRLYAALVPGIIVPDGVVYIESAKMVAAGQWQKIADIGIYSLYPFLIALSQKVFTDWETAARILSVVFGSLAVLPFYLLLRRMFDLRIALVASIFFIVSPRLVEYSSNVIREPVFWFFSFAALWSAWEGMVRKQYLLVAASSILIGLSTLTRMEGAAFAVVILLWIFWYCLKVDRSARRRLPVYLLVFIVSFPLISITPLYLLKSRLGRWEIGHIGTKIPQILETGSEGMHETLRDSLDSSDIIARVVTQNKYVFFVYESIYKTLRSYHVLLVFLFLIGITRRKIVPWDQIREIPVIMWCYIFFLVFLLYVSRIFYLSTRHGMLISVPALVWVSIGFYELSDIIRRGVARFGPRGFQLRHTTAWCLVLICLIMLPKTLSWSGYDKIEMKKAGAFLKYNGYAKGTIAIEQRFVRLAFYADANYIVIPQGTSPGKLKAFLKSNNVQMLVIDERSIDSVVPGFKDGIGGIGLQRLKVPELEKYKEYSIALFKPEPGRPAIQG